MTEGAITFRDVHPQDFEAMHGLVTFWEVTRNLGTWPWPPDAEFTRKRCMPFEGDGFVWAVCANTRFIGTVSVVRGELGYMLHPEFHGKGIITRAVQDALDHAFDTLKLDEIHADIWADNLASRHILGRAGFVLTKETIDHAVARDALTESETYSLTRAAWLARNPPRIVTDRLVLRAIRREDAKDIVRIAGNFEVSKWLMPVPHPYELSDAHAFIYEVQVGAEGYVWAITQNEMMIGAIGIDEIVGYYLQPESWGCGLMSEAVAAVVAWRFDQDDLDRIRSGFFDRNHGSRRVLEKNGFRPVGQNMRFCEARGKDVPHHDMELTRTNWSALMPSEEYRNASAEG